MEIAEYLIEAGADVNFMEAEDDDPGLRAPVLFDAINWSIHSADNIMCSPGAYPFSQDVVRKQLQCILDCLIDMGISGGNLDIELFEETILEDFLKKLRELEFPQDTYYVINGEKTYI